MSIDYFINKIPWSNKKPPKFLLDLISVMKYAFWSTELFLTLSSSYIFLFFFCPWWFVLLYFTWFYYTRNYPYMAGSKRMDFFRNNICGAFWSRHMPNTHLIKTSDLNPEYNYLIAHHPHEITSISGYINYCTNVTGFEKKFPGITTCTCAITWIFYLPFFRELFLLCGVGSVSSSHIDYIFSSSSSGGKATVLVTGGAAEVLESHPWDEAWGNKCRLVLKNRKGFIRSAIRNGAHLVPSFTFGETLTYEQGPNYRGSRLRRFQDWSRRKFFSFPPVLIKGGSEKGWFAAQISPVSVPMFTVVGSPISVVRNPNPTQDEIDQLHSQYLKELNELFESHKAKYSIYPNAQLEFV